MKKKKKKKNCVGKREGTWAATLDWLYSPFRPQSPTTRRVREPSSLGGWENRWSSAAVKTTPLKAITTHRRRPTRRLEAAASMAKIFWGTKRNRRCVESEKGMRMQKGEAFCIYIGATKTPFTLCQQAVSTTLLIKSPLNYYFSF